MKHPTKKSLQNICSWGIIYWKIVVFLQNFEKFLLEYLVCSHNITYFFYKNTSNFPGEPKIVQEHINFAKQFAYFFGDFEG